MTPGRLVVFDVDGTLVDSQHVILAAMRRAFDAAGLAAPLDRSVLDIVGLSLPEAMAVLVPEIAPEVRAGLVEHYREGSGAGRAGGLAEIAPLYPGARAALDRLARRSDTLIGLATGKGRRGLDHILQAHALEGVFATQQTADLHPSKPDPAMLEAALVETGCDRRGAVMVGDTEYDILMGRAARFATIGVAWGYHAPGRLRAAGADAVILAFEALDAALDALGSRS